MNIDININRNKCDSVVKARGRLCNTITDDERNTFGLGDDQIKSAMEALHGRRPNDVFVRSPTPWNDLYSTYSWKQVQRITTVRSAEIVEFKDIPVVVSQTILNNNSSKRGTFQKNLSTNVTNTASSNWERGHGISVGQKISYGFKWGDVGLEGDTSFGYNHSWGQGGSESKVTSLSVGSGITVELEPGEKILAQIIARRAKAKIKVEYESCLTGSVAINYYPTHKGHHFWSWDVNSIMQQNNRQNSYISTEIISINLLSNMEVNLRARGVQ